MRLLPTRQGLIDNIWAAILFAAATSLGGAIWARKHTLEAWIPGALYILATIFACAYVIRTFVRLKEGLRARMSGAVERIGRSVATPDLSPQPMPVRVKASIHPLSEQWSERHSPEDRLRVGFMRRTYAVLEVSNKSDKNIPGLVAKRRLVGETEWILDPVWSKKSGQAFVAGGNHQTALGAGDHRLLVVAQAFGDGAQWARLEQPLSEIPSSTSNYGSDRKVFYGKTGKELNFGRDVKMELRLSADGSSARTYVLNLTFIGSSPEVSLSDATSAHRRNRL